VPCAPEIISMWCFEPDRWPAGDPGGLEDLSAAAPDYHDLAWNTVTVLPDCDASPTKAWIIEHRKEEDVEPIWHLSFGKRPREELYDLRVDPHYMHNLAMSPDHDSVRAELQARLMAVLRAQNDPRLVQEAPCHFEREPFGGFLPKYVLREGATADTPWREQFEIARRSTDKGMMGTFNGTMIGPVDGRPLEQYIEEDQRARERDLAKPAAGRSKL